MAVSQNIRDIVQRIIYPALEGLGSPTSFTHASELVLGTGLVESGYRAIVQHGGGPALGFWQMEPATHEDIWQHFLGFRGTLAEQVLRNSHISGGIPDAETLTFNLRYGAAMCRVHYLRSPDPIPDNPEGQARMWREVYNTHLGKGTVEKYMEAWRNAGL